MLGKDIKTVLNTITQESMTNGTMSDLWEKFPDHVAGPDWVGEILDIARTLSDYINDEEEFTDDYPSEISYRIADSEVEDYHVNINKRVQALSLWAYPELDDEVTELIDGRSQTLTDLNSLYLYCAVRGLSYQILTYAYEKAEELEEAI